MLGRYVFHTDSDSPLCSGRLERVPAMLEASALVMRWHFPPDRFYSKAWEHQILQKALILVCLSLVILRIARIGSRETTLPPGPPTILILGNATLIPRERAYLAFTEWAKQYGGIYSLKILSSTMIVLTDLAAVYQLLEKRSASSSDRPPFQFGDVVTDGMNVGLICYGKTWRLLRRCGNEILSQSESIKHLPIQKAETAQLLHDLLKTPEDFYSHVGRFINSIIMSVVFGIRCPRHDIQHAVDFYEMEARWNILLEPGVHPPVDLIPALRYTPERWAPWKTECREVRQMQQKLFFGLLSQSEDRIERGEENGSFVESLLKRQEELQLNRELIAHLGAAMLEGGSETGTSFLRTLILVLVEHPEVVEKAQEEIDQVVGGTRIPDIKDAANLPYIHAIINETYRFRPPAPAALPHALVSDEMYQNYHIPKGSTILINVWGIFHDPDLFDQPDSFWPDRYILSEHGTKPDYNVSSPRPTLVFGAGRRICPGMHLANNTLLLAVMNLIWAFNFERPLDATGQPLDLDDYSTGLVIGPNPFNCRITPRSMKRAALIEKTFAEAIETLGKYESDLPVFERSVASVL